MVEKTQPNSNIPSGRKLKPHLEQHNPKSSDETKLTFTNSYSSEPESPSMMTYCSYTGENSKMTSQNKGQTSQK